MTDPTLSEAMISAIDARIRAQWKMYTAVGTLTSRIDTLNANVAFDGSSVDLPVKVSGDVEPTEGDRVGLVKYGEFWVVTTVMARRFFNETGASVIQSTTGTTTSASLTFIPDACAVSWTKRWDDTRVHVKITFSCWTDVAATAVQFGAQFSSPVYATATVGVGGYLINPVSTHTAKTDWTYISGYAAGTYTVSTLWARNGGTGTLHVDASDGIMLEVSEVQ